MRCINWYTPHKWTKWTTKNGIFEKTYLGKAYPSDIRGKPFEVTKEWQERKCIKCGLKQKRNFDSG